MALDPERPVTLPKVTPEGSAPGSDLLENIRKLETRFERAQGEIEKLKESDRSWLKKAGLVLGFLGGLIATPRLIKETYEVLFTRANTTIEWGAPLNIRYDQHDRVLRLDFPVLLSNDGRSNDVIEELSARVYPDLRKANVNVPAGDADIEVSDEGHSIPQPLSIPYNQPPRSLIIALSLDHPFSEQALGFEGKRVVDVVMRMHNGKRITKQYCFDFDKFQNQEVLSAKAKQIRTPFLACE